MSFSGKRVLLVGLDSAEWTIVKLMAEAGQMPVLSNFLEQGSTGKIRTLYPTHAPLLWTSVATGKAADKHGIMARAAGPESRRVKAIWNMASEGGLSTHLIGWPSTHPAEHLKGVCVSPLFAISTVPDGKQWPLPEGSVYPPELAETLSPLRLHPGDVPLDAILQLVPRARDIKQRYDDRLSRMAAGLAACCSIHNAATWALENRPWDFAAVHYSAIGDFSRDFMAFHPPQRRGIADADFGLYRDVVAGIYRLIDMFLGRLMQIAGPDCITILVSAHGFECGDKRPVQGDPARRNPEAWHTGHGFLGMFGKGIIRDDVLHGASLLDIAPTVLTLLGLPAGEDFDGRVLIQAFEEVPSLPSIPTWEPEVLAPTPSFALNSVGARGVAEHFVAFDRLDGGTNFVEDRQFNLVSVYMSSGRPALALPLIEKLAESAPENLRYQRCLVQCYLSGGQVSEAESVLLPLLSGREVYGWMHFLHGVMLMHQERTDEALHAFQQAGADPQTAPFVPAFIGNIYLAKRMLEAAEEFYMNALRLDSENPEAFTGLAALRLQQNRDIEAADHALRAVNLRYDSPIAHYYLGLALTRLGQEARAETAFEATLKLAPDILAAQDHLKRLRSSNSRARA